MPQLLVVTAIVIILCVFLNKLTSRSGIPLLLVFIALGMLFGSDGIFKIPFDDYSFAEKICSVALIFIMFYGGFVTNRRAAKPVAPQAILMSSLGVLLTAALTGAFCFFALKINLAESFLVGALLGSTDAASVFFILRSKKLNLKYHTASLLEVESGSNDPSAYMLTVILLSVMNGSASGGVIVYTVFAQIVYGLLIGGAIALLALLVLKKVKFTVSGFDTIFVVGVAILSYALPTLIGGNGYLSVYIVGIVLGNTDIKEKKTLLPFFDGINGLMQMLIFFLLGLLSTPTKLPSVMLVSLFIALFVTFVSRPLASFAVLAPFKSKVNQILLVSWSGLRGASSIVFAIMAITTVTTTTDLFDVVFCVVLFSILLQGSLLPLVSKKLKMIDDSSPVMKTFNDYSEEEPIRFIQFSVTEKHPWAEKKVREITLPPETILVLLLRGDKQIVPDGKTLLQAGDALVLCARSTGEIEGVNLSERKVSSEDKYAGKTPAQIDDDTLIIMIERKGKILIPKGDTQIQEGDTLVLNKRKE